MLKNKIVLFSLTLAAIWSAIWAPVFCAEILRDPDPSKPLYQKQWGGPVISWPFGDVDEVSWPKPETIQEATLRLKIQRLEETAENESKMKRDGRLKMQWGVTGLIFGVIAMVVLGHWGLEIFGLAVALIGFGSILDGALTMKLADNITAVAVGAGFLVAIVIIYFFTHGRGLNKDVISKAKTKINKLRSGLKSGKKEKGI